MEITKELLKQKFEEYNKLYFNNELAMCRFTYIYMRDVFGRYTTNITAKGEKIGHIWISRSIELDEEMLRDLLVHEMIHHYVRTNEKPKVTFGRKAIAFLRNRLHLF